MLNYYFGLFCCLILFSCNQPNIDNDKQEPKKKESVLQNFNQTNEIVKPLIADINSEKKGIVGLFDVPEMLCLSIIDSTEQKYLSDKLGNNFAILEKELKEIKSEIDGAPGVLYYNNNPNNFKFECVLLIKKMPNSLPKKSKIIALEASKMLIYNYFGPYQNLSSAYDAIRLYLSNNKLFQSGPMREFYISDPMIEKNTNKWLTRIMVPVNNTK